jgi:hypothetical protein
MNHKSWKRNTTGLVAHAQRRANETRQRVQQAIEQLTHERKRVNFTVVAATAHVTKAYLYSQPQLRERIEALRQQPAPATGRPERRVRTSASNDIVLAAKERRIQALEAENRRLKAELQIALGKLYEQL